MSDKNGLLFRVTQDRALIIETPAGEIKIYERREQRSGRRRGIISVIVPDGCFAHMEPGKEEQHGSTTLQPVQRVSGMEGVRSKVSVPRQGDVRPLHPETEDCG